MVRNSRHRIRDELKAAAEHEKLKSVAPGERWKFMETSRRWSPYFRQWRTLRWFLAMLAPASLGAIAAAARGQPWGLVGVLSVMGPAIAAFLFVTIASGTSSSN